MSQSPDNITNITPVICSNKSCHAILQPIEALNHQCVNDVTERCPFTSCLEVSMECTKDIQTAWQNDLNRAISNGHGLLYEIRQNTLHFDLSTQGAAERTIEMARYEESKVKAGRVVLCLPPLCQTMRFSSDTGITLTSGANGVVVFGPESVVLIRKDGSSGTVGTALNDGEAVLISENPKVATAHSRSPYGLKLTFHGSLWKEVADPGFVGTLTDANDMQLLRRMALIGELICSDPSHRDDFVKKFALNLGPCATAKVYGQQHPKKYEGLHHVAKFLRQLGVLNERADDPDEDLDSDMDVTGWLANLCEAVMKAYRKPIIDPSLAAMARYSVQCLACDAVDAGLRKSIFDFLAGHLMSLENVVKATEAHLFLEPGEEIPAPVAVNGTLPALKDAPGVSHFDFVGVSQGGNVWWLECKEEYLAAGELFVNGVVVTDLVSLLNGGDIIQLGKRAHACTRLIFFEKESLWQKCPLLKRDGVFAGKCLDLGEGIRSSNFPELERQEIIKIGKLNEKPLSSLAWAIVCSPGNCDPRSQVPCMYKYDCNVQMMVDVDVMMCEAPAGDVLDPNLFSKMTATERDRGDDQPAKTVAAVKRISITQRHKFLVFDRVTAKASAPKESLTRKSDLDLYEVSAHDKLAKDFANKTFSDDEARELFCPVYELKVSLEFDPLVSWGKLDGESGFTGKSVRERLVTGDKNVVYFVSTPTVVQRLAPHQVPNPLLRCLRGIKNMMSHSGTGGLTATEKQWKLKVERALIWAVVAFFLSQPTLRQNVEKRL